MNVNSSKCLYCGGCVGVCPYDALYLEETLLVFDKKKCVNCGLCYQFCPVGAIMEDEDK